LENQHREDIIYYQRIIVLISVILIILISIFAFIFLKQKNKLNKLNSLKDKFFSVVAHDIRNPVSTILSISDELVEDFDEISNQEKEQLISILQKSTIMLNELISNLFAWSSFQRGFISFNPENFDVNKISADTVEILNLNASEKKIILNYAGTPGLVVNADKKMVESVLMNLINNAVKFTPQEGAISVSVKKIESFAEILVEDNGVGIPVDVQKSLFKIETSKSSNGTEGEKGTGLGLLICKEFVEINKGKIWVESEPGIGSRFFVRFPLA
jgi:signal transduction histidine kinase